MKTLQITEQEYKIILQALNQMGTEQADNLYDKLENQNT